MSARPLFVMVLGAGTDIGKTFVACQLVADLRARGLRVAVRKPVLSGFVDDDASDPARLQRAAGTDEPLARVSPWRFPLPISLDAAARAAGISVDFDAVVAAAQDVDDGVDVVVVEGAGGVMSPLTARHTQLDLCAALGADGDIAVVIVVDGATLGCFSHGLCAVHVAEAAVDVDAVVVNRGDDDALATFVRFLPERVVLPTSARSALADRVWERIGARMPADQETSR